MSARALPTSAEWADLDEEANVFAAYLLMPDPMFRQAMKNVDLTDDEALGKVARRFRVSIGAVVYRAMLERQFAESRKKRKPRC
jgi:Zn-dependent peptidase ImmA (M78 family)